MSWCSTSRSFARIITTWTPKSLAGCSSGLTAKCGSSRPHTTAVGEAWSPHLSLRPRSFAQMPRIIAGIAKTHETWKLIEASGAFAAHLVEESQAELVWHFGLQSSRDVDKFVGLEVGTVGHG